MLVTLNILQIKINKKYIFGCFSRKRVNSKAVTNSFCFVQVEMAITFSTCVKSIHRFQAVHQAFSLLGQGEQGLLALGQIDDVSRGGEGWSDVLGSLDPPQFDQTWNDQIRLTFTIQRFGFYARSVILPRPSVAGWTFRNQETFLNFLARILRKYDVIWPSPICERSTSLSCNLDTVFP